MCACVHTNSARVPRVGAAAGGCTRSRREACLPAAAHTQHCKRRLVCVAAQQPAAAVRPLVPCPLLLCWRPMVGTLWCCLTACRHVCQARQGLLRLFLSDCAGYCCIAHPLRRCQLHQVSGLVNNLCMHPTLLLHAKCMPPTCRLYISCCVFVLSATWGGAPCIVSSTGVVCFVE